MDMVLIPNPRQSSSISKSGLCMPTLISFSKFKFAMPIKKNSPPPGVF